MALGSPRNLFGIHSVAPYSKTDGTPYGILKVLGSSSLALSADLVKLTGGSNRYPWAVEDGLVSAEVSLKVKEFPDFLFTLFLGKAPTANSAETSGNVSTITDLYGTSTVDASTGIASVSAIATTGPANLKFGRYLVKVVTSTTVDVYCLSDVDFLRGTDAEYTGDALKTHASQTITSGADTNLTTLGVKLTGGSGTIGMTVGDTATFEVRPINTASITARIGVSGDTNPEFGMVCVTQKRGNGQMFEVDLFRCKGAGLPLGFDEFKWAEADIKVEALYDSTKNGVFDIRHVTPTSVV